MFGLIFSIAGSNHVMAAPPITLWQTIDTLAQQIPFTQAKVERVLSVTLSDPDPGTLVFQPTLFRFLEGGPLTLANGVVIENVDLRVRHTGDDPDFLALDIAGSCIRLNVVRAHYGDLKITDHPRGHSLNDVTSHTAVLPWGELSFSFAERNPDCLSSIVLDPSVQEANNAAG